MTNQCPICKIKLTDSFPDFCETCGWELRNDLTLVPSLDLPQMVIDDYQKRLNIARRLWQERLEMLKSNQKLAQRLKKQDELEERLRRMEDLLANAKPPQEHKQPPPSPPVDKLPPPTPAPNEKYATERPLPEFQRDTFETSEEFYSRINHYPPVLAGKGALIKEKYDIHTGDFPLKIEWLDWVRKLPGMPYNAAFSVIAARETAKTIYAAGSTHPIFVTFKMEGDVVMMKQAELVAGDQALALTLPEAKKLGENEWLDPITGIIFVRVPGGKFQMGDTFGDGEDNEKPVHEVELDPFYIGKYPVTQGQWLRVMEENPAKFKNGDDYPVERVSWDDAQEFIEKLTQLHGNRYQFGLPSEAQWEYAARSGGKKEKYAGGYEVDEAAWFEDNSRDQTHPVGKKKPNGLGLYDMSGNVWEWCQDIYADNAYSQHAKKNPIYMSGGSERVLRGGSWNFDPAYARCAYRLFLSPGYRFSNIGFRLQRTS